jgi:hypothetical protein
MRALEVFDLTEAVGRHALASLAACRSASAARSSAITWF